MEDGCMKRWAVDATRAIYCYLAEVWNAITGR